MAKVSNQWEPVGKGKGQSKRKRGPSSKQQEEVCLNQRMETQSKPTKNGKPEVKQNPPLG